MLKTKFEDCVLSTLKVIFIFPVLSIVNPSTTSKVSGSSFCNVQVFPDKVAFKILKSEGKSSLVIVISVIWKPSGWLGVRFIVLEVVVSLNKFCSSA